MASVLNVVSPFSPICWVWSINVVVSWGVLSPLVGGLGLILGEHLVLVSKTFDKLKLSL